MDRQIFFHPTLKTIWRL